MFAVFDLVWLNGKDLRSAPLTERKQRLRALVPSESPHLLHVDCVPEYGKELFALACEKDLENVVGKWAQGTYQADGRTICPRHAAADTRSAAPHPPPLCTSKSALLATAPTRAYSDDVLTPHALVRMPQELGDVHMTRSGEFVHGFGIMPS